MPSCVDLVWSDQVDTHTKAWLRGVDLHLGMLLVHLALRLHLVYSLFEQYLKLRLALQLFVVLGPCIFEKSSLMLHHLPEFLHDSVISSELLLFRLHLPLWEVNDRAGLLARGNSTKAALVAAHSHVGRSAAYGGTYVPGSLG